MTNEITLLAPENIRTADTQTLKAALAQSLDITVRHLRYLAAIWHELENRGEDLSNLRHGLLAYLPMIASERVDPRLVINHAGQQTLLNALSRLPIERQHELAESGHVTVARIEGKSVSEVQVPLARLSAAEVYRVFGENGVRAPAEQIKSLSVSVTRKPTRAIPRRARKIEVISEENVLIVGSAAADLDRAIAVIGRHYGLNLSTLISDHTAARDSMSASNNT